jgi:hypothetical protein
MCQLTEEAGAGVAAQADLSESSTVYEQIGVASTLPELGPERGVLKIRGMLAGQRGGVDCDLNDEER